MTKQVLFVQGAGESAHDAWDDKLVQSLERELGKGYTVLYPRMPDEADPHFSAWRAALVHALDELEDGAILIGHSVGGAILIRVLAERRLKHRVGAVALIATPFSEIEPPADFAKRLPADLPVFLYHGTADDVVPIEHVERYAKLIPRAVVRRLADRDHQLNNDLRDVARDIAGIRTPAGPATPRP